MVLAFLLLSLCPGQAQTEFLPTDEFPIPSKNSTIHFATNGTYTSATLENGTWIFKDLNFTTSAATFLGLNVTSGSHTLRFSAENCNVTILAYQTFNYSSPISLIAYTVEGEGTQTVNLGLDKATTDSSEWSIIVEGEVFLAEGQGWRRLPDDSILVSAAAHNVSIVHFNFGDAGMSGAGFLLQHYVLLFAGAVLAATVAVAVTLKIRRRRHGRGGNSNKPKALT
jgi:hypothetical protein